MSEPTLTQEQRAILRRLRQTTAHHTQLTTAADAQWQEVQRAYEEVRARLAEIGEEQALQSVATRPPAAPPGADPAAAFRSSAERALQAAQELQALLATPSSWRQHTAWTAHGRPILGVIGPPFCVVVFSPDGRLLASGGNDKTVKVWEVASRRAVHTLTGHTWPVLSVAFSPDGRLLASGSVDGTVKVWEVASGQEVRTLTGHTDWVLGVAFSPDGRLLASGSRDNTVKIWEVASWQEMRILTGHTEPVCSVVFSPDGRLLVSGSLDKTVKIWEVASGRTVRTLTGHTNWVWSVAFSPDGRLLASGSQDKTVKVWEVASGQEVRTLTGHTNRVWSVAFSPDGRLLVSGGDDKTVKVWEVSTGRLLQDLRWTHNVRGISFSPDGHWLAVSGETQIQLFQGTWPELPQRAAALAQAMAEARFWYDRLQDQAAADYRRTLQEQILASYHQWQDSFNRYDRPAPFPWQDRRWQDWAASTQAEQDLLRLGEMQKLTAQQRLEMPALLAFPTSRSLLFKTAAASRAVAARATQSLLLRLLASLPPGKLRFTFIDPVGLGQNAAPFMHLADYDEQLVTGKAWSEPQHIEQRLADLTEHMENVIQQYLRNQYATIEDYNTQAGEIAEAYRVLVVFDFPVNFSETAARRLVSIAQNGPRCGVYAIILIDTDKPLPHGFNPADLERNAEVIAWQDGRWVWQDEDFRECALELDTPPAAELFNRIVKAVGEAAKAASKVEVPFERIAPPREQWWLGDSRSGIRVPLGPAGARKVQELALGQGTAQHVLVAGKTGSGKSTLLHILITNLALTYSPDEVELYLIDFKKGVEFKAYAAHQLPHARVVAIESEREFGLSVLQGLDAELKRRGDFFRAAGADHIADYRQKTGQTLPRILLLVDEFQEFFTEDDAIASQASQILDRLVRQGRAFGLHVLLGSQTLAGAYSLARSTVDQMAVRIALQCSEADSRLILADDNPAARLLSRPGEAIYNAANGMVEGNSRFQVAWLPDDKRDGYLAQVAVLAQQRNYRPPRPQIVFEGNAPAEVEKNRLLQDLLKAPEWPAPTRRALAWLGDPIAIRDPIAAAFRRQSGSNLLIVGQNDEAALGMMTVALISLAAQHKPETVTFYVLDFGAVDAPYAGLWDQLAGVLPHPVKVGRRRQLPEFIAELATEVQQRLDNEQPGAPARYLFLYGLQRARDLRQEEMGFGGFGGFGEEPARPIRRSNSPPSCARDPTWASTPWSGATR
jgi:energy-coupling factor transporter ATP-binding protein EcfA2